MGSFSLRQVLAVARSLGIRCVVQRSLYGFRQRRYERDEPALTSCPEDEPLGEVAAQTQGGQALELECDGGILRVELMAIDLFRLRLRRSGEALDPVFSYALDPGAEWPAVPFEMEEDGAGWTVRTQQIACQVTRSPCRVSFFTASGLPLSEAGDGMGHRGLGAFCTRSLAEGEMVFGLAEKALDLNLRGRALEMWNRDPEGYSPGDDPINLNIPFLLGLRQGRAYGLFFDNPGRCRFDLGHAQHDRLRYEADTGELCLYFFGGPTPAAVVERYCQLTGRMPLPPRWMLGYHQSRWSYYPEREVREVVGEFRRRRIPCDAIHLDIHHLDGYRVFTWDAGRFSDPGQLMADLRDQGFRLISILDPGVKVDPGGRYAVYEAGKDREVFCRLPDGSDFRGPVWPGSCCFPDFTNPEVRRWWGDLYQPLLEAGVAGFWNDMNEPAVFGGEMPSTVRHDYEGRGASHREVHNIYGLQMARASAEGLRRLCPDERVPLISRAGYAGLQRYALVWTADNGSTWAHLRLAVKMCLNLGLSGVAFCGPDIGGFAGDCDGELLARWTQVGAFTPFFRNHSALGTARQEPWAFGEPYESICRRWIELRYRLLPYLYTTAWQAASSGQPMMRAMALAFPDDAQARGLEDQFLLGDALLAAPVGQPGQRARNVQLPGEVWYDFWTGAKHMGAIKAEAPLERMPLYVRAGSVVPMGPVVQHTGEWPPRCLDLHIYPGSGESWLYDDDGHSQAYRDGVERVTRFGVEDDGEGLTVVRRVEGPFQPGYEQFEVTVYGLEVAPRRVAIDGRAVEAAFDAGRGRPRLVTEEWGRLDIEG